jgi:hypothetical protein
MQAQIAASLRHLKEAAAHLSETALAIGDADKLASANIDRLLQAALAEIKRLEQLNLSQD